MLFVANLQQIGYNISKEVTLLNIGEKIKQRRKELGLTVDEVANKIGKNRATVYRYESNKIEDMPVGILIPLSHILQTTPSYLMGWEENISSAYNAKEQKKLMEIYSMLNEKGQQALLSYAGYVIKQPENLKAGTESNKIVS